MKKILVAIGCLLTVGVMSSVCFADGPTEPLVKFTFDNSLEFSHGPDHTKMADSCAAQCSPYAKPPETPRGLEHCKSCCMGSWPAKGKSIDASYNGKTGCKKH